MQNARRPFWTLSTWFFSPRLCNFWRTPRSNELVRSKHRSLRTWHDVFHIFTPCYSELWCFKYPWNPALWGSRVIVCVCGNQRHSSRISQQNIRNVAKPLRFLRRTAEKLWKVPQHPWYSPWATLVSQTCTEHRAQSTWESKGAVAVVGKSVYVFGWVCVPPAVLCDFSRYIRRAVGTRWDKAIMGHRMFTNYSSKIDEDDPRSIKVPRNLHHMTAQTIPSPGCLSPPRSLVGIVSCSCYYSRLCSVLEHTFRVCSAGFSLEKYMQYTIVYITGQQRSEPRIRKKSSIYQRVNGMHKKAGTRQWALDFFYLRLPPTANQRSSLDTPRIDGTTHPRHSEGRTISSWYIRTPVQISAMSRSE